MKKILFICLIGVITSLFARSDIQIAYEYYPVKVSKVSELPTTLNKASPITEDGKKYHAYTRWNIEWRYRWRVWENRCKVSTVSTRLTITYTLPKLINLTQNETIDQVWNEWYPNLVAHEKNHATNAIKTSQDIEEAIMKVPENRECEKLGKEVNKVAEKLMDELAQKNKEYDRATNHGKTEGAFIEEYL